MPFEADLMTAVRRHASTRLVPTAVRALTSDLDRYGPRKTGRMLRARRVRQFASGDTIGAEIAYPSKQAGMLDEGLRPHVIRARRARVLRFVVGGQVIYRRQVNWRPGAGAARAKGWFTNRVKQWGRYLSQAAR